MSKGAISHDPPERADSLVRRVPFGGLGALAARRLGLCAKAMTENRLYVIYALQYTSSMAWTWEKPLVIVILIKY